MYEQLSLTMSYVRGRGLSFQRIPSWHAIRSLLVHENVELVFGKMALETSRTAFVFTRQACMPPLLK